MDFYIEFWELKNEDCNLVNMKKGVCIEEDIFMNS